MWELTNSFCCWSLNNWKHLRTIICKENCEQIPQLCNTWLQYLGKIFIENPLLPCHWFSVLIRCWWEIVEKNWCWIWRGSVHNLGSNDQWKHFSQYFCNILNTVAVLPHDWWWLTTVVLQCHVWSSWWWWWADRSQWLCPSCRFFRSL